MEDIIFLKIKGWKNRLKVNDNSISSNSRIHIHQSIQGLVFPRGKLGRFVRTDGQRAGKIHFVMFMLVQIVIQNQKEERWVNFFLSRLAWMVMKFGVHSIFLNTRIKNCQKQTRTANRKVNLQQLRLTTLFQSFICSDNPCIRNSDVPFKRQRAFAPKKGRQSLRYPSQEEQSHCQKVRTFPWNC